MNTIYELLDDSERDEREGTCVDDSGSEELTLYEENDQTRPGAKWACWGGWVMDSGFVDGVQSG